MSCDQINIPYVDNSDSPCQSSLSSTCVFNPDALTYLGLSAFATQAEINQALLNSLIDARNRIYQLENS